jgi:transposase
MDLLFNEAEVAVETPSPTPESEGETTSEDPKDKDKHKKRNRGKRNKLPPHLPRERIELALDESQGTCLVHQKSLVKIGEEIIEKLEFIPAQVKVIEYVTPIFKATCCENVFVQPARDPDPIPKSFVTPSLLAQIVIAKFVDSMPLYRQERFFNRLDIDLDRTTMARWMIQAAELASPLDNLMFGDLIESDVIHMDETTIQVLNEPNRAAESKSYMWTLGRQGPQPIILYRYYENRNKKAASELLLGFTGVVVCDGYNVYESLAKDGAFILAGCMAHVRRKFWLAEKWAKKEAKDATSIIASRALALIRSLYAIEASLAGMSLDMILETRQKKSLPILNALKAWLLDASTKVLPSCPTGKAISYALDQWEKIVYYASDARVPIDNNFMEAHIRPFTIGRKNWLFAASQKGAHASATLYSLIETCKANGIDPLSYLTLIFKELPKVKDAEGYVKLLPYNVSAHFEIKTYNPAGPQVTTVH